eukprot:CAMPEP_0196821056 /NCGR_PEP_ID=MMETSP1362-20130617/77600_1 /TAXON_ID=163516 /ORGANISM="Leptocylindrus danicus, Strain CCMP1856" /LENGTH=391 /DNA_ID=CAMNT_0042200119 /DNA_START=98 /DNA_END=1270 /DNA_ORIENTATION=-
MSSISTSAVPLRVHALLLLLAVSHAFTTTTTNTHNNRSTITPASKLYASSSTSDDAANEAKLMLERVRKMREEIASLEGKSTEQVEREAERRAEERKSNALRAQAEREQLAMSRSSPEYIEERRVADGKFLIVPENAGDQVRQAAEAVERAFRDGKTRQIVRFELIPEGEVLNQDRQWPGGAEQMVREAGKPLTQNLLSEVRAPVNLTAASLGSADAEMNAVRLKKPNIITQDVWDFDGSALITAEAGTGPSDDVQALVFPNTDNKYTRDIRDIDAAMQDRLFLLINPFWRNVESWGFNLLAPKAKEMAQEVIFDRGFEETYVLNKFSVRGEECVALKVYPFDWQLYAYLEDEYSPSAEYLVHLGSTGGVEPTSADFGRFLGGREEFKLNK